MKTKTELLVMILSLGGGLALGFFFKDYSVGIAVFLILFFGINMSIEMFNDFKESKKEE